MNDESYFSDPAAPPVPPAAEPGPPTPPAAPFVAGPDGVRAPETEPAAVGPQSPPVAEPTVPNPPIGVMTSPPVMPPPPAPTTPSAMPAPPAGPGVGTGRAGAGSGSGWRQFVVGALIGALVGGGTAAGVTLATRDDSAGGTRTVVVGGDNRPVRESSTIGSAGDIQEVLAKVDGAVVAIQTGGRVDAGLFEGEGGGSGGAGTGFVVSADGVIVTNSHVVAGADGRIQVEFPDGTKLGAELLGRAVEYDLAVLKVDAQGLPTLALGSSDDLQVGDEVVAVGNALALEGGLSVTRGIISGKGRVVPEAETGVTLYDMLQTDAAINPGNSGGPLVNAEGEVIGINTALAGGSQNVGFAISVDSAKSVIRQLRAGTNVKVAFLGVETAEVTPAISRSLDLETRTGAVIRSVSNGTAADRAGLRRDDVIVAIGGQAVDGPEDVGAEVRRFTPGDEVAVTVERAGSLETVTVTLGERPDSLG